ncbi:GlcG/HbpS family heme-binding protein [Pelagibius marinus]|uniref:GlcG/HbpS family heme-binding protein n=1 Tax=Pelagibius marinus TaxID=2762760 RepID=UPI001872D9B3|nr:heme-binding protein [Pelagibius marinus]
MKATKAWLGDIAKFERRRFKASSVAAAGIAALGLLLAPMELLADTPVPNTFPLPYGPDIGQSCATAALNASLDHARANNLNVTVAVVDTSGRVVVLSRMDNAHKAGVDFAIEKALSAALYKRSTKIFSDALAGGRQAILGFMNLHVHAAEGGEVLVIKDEIVGGIGAAGATQQQDRAIANAGVQVASSCASAR